MFLLATEHALQLDVQLLNLAAGVIVPLLVGALSKLNASSRVKAVLNLALSAVAGALATAIAADGSIIFEEWATGIGMTWLTSIVSYYGLWRPTEVAPAVARSTARFGLGSNSPTA